LSRAGGKAAFGIVQEHQVRGSPEVGGGPPDGLEQAAGIEGVLGMATCEWKEPDLAGDGEPAEEIARDASQGAMGREPAIAERRVDCPGAHVERGGQDAASVTRPV
jgi:hypothetical protein